MSYRLLSLGVNSTPFAKKALRFAELDAVRLARAFTSSRGPVSADGVVVLRGRQANLAAVRAELDMLTLFPPEHLLFAWTGHGGDDGIALSDGILTYEELAWRLGAIGARVKVAVLATCHAGAARRPFQTHIAGVGDIGLAWEHVLLAACPGLRLFTAVGPNELAYDDPTVQGSRFLYGFLRALRCAPGDIEHNGYRWISDVSLMPRVRSIIARRWPGEALPSLVGPTGPCAPFPLLVSQAEEPFGLATASVVPADGVSIRASIHAYDRKFVDTCVETTAVADDGTVFLSARVPFLPNAAANRFDWTFTVDGRDLLDNPSTGIWLHAGLPVRLTWHVRVLDDHAHVLDEAIFANSYGWKARAA